MKINNGILTEKEIQARTKFWNKKQFRTWSKKELERTSTDMQKLLVALKESTMAEIIAIRMLYGSNYRVYNKKDPEYIVRWADQKDLDYAISIAPKTFKVKRG